MFFNEFEGRRDHFCSLGGDFWPLGARHASLGSPFGSQEVEKEPFPSARERKVSPTAAPARFSGSQGCPRGVPDEEGTATLREYLDLQKSDV